MSNTNRTADALLHVFSTFMGMPPDTETPPVCGATLTRAYDWDFRGVRRPKCRACERILRAHHRKASR